MMFRVVLAAVGVVGAAVFVIRGLLTRKAAQFDAGGVSQSWLTEHNSGKGDRFS